MKTKIPKEKKVNIEFENAKFIILKLCSDIKFINWPREIKIAKKLLEKYNDIKFWESLEKYLSSHYIQGNSLSRFLIKENSYLLDEALAEHLRQNLVINNPPQVKMEENKVGEDRKIIKPTTSLLDFLNK